MNNKDIFYQFTKEIFQQNDGVEIDFDDSKLTITFKLTQADQDKINNALNFKQLDSKSIIKAPSTNLFYCLALSKPSSQKYWSIDEIAHLPQNTTDTSLNKFISGEYNNNLKLDSKGLLKAETPHYKQILTEKDGKFSSNTWTFQHSLLKNTKYYFVFDISKLLSDVRPFQIEVGTVPFKLPTLVQTYQVVAIDGSIKGWIEISIDAVDGLINIKSNVLSAEDEISIYEWETQLFYSTKDRNW